MPFTSIIDTAAVLSEVTDFEVCSTTIIAITSLNPPPAVVTPTAATTASMNFDLTTIAVSTTAKATTAATISVEIVMLEKLNCILSERARRPVKIWTYQYGWMPSTNTRVNSHIQPYETSPSPAIRDILISGHTSHLRLWSYKTSPSPTVQDIFISDWIRHLHLRRYQTFPSLAETCICNNHSHHYRSHHHNRSNHHRSSNCRYKHQLHHSGTRHDRSHHHRGHYHCCYYIYPLLR